MNTHEHTLRKQLRAAIDQGMTASLSVGEAVEVAVMAAEVFATAIRGAEAGRKHIYVVSWPDPTPAERNGRRALGFYEEELALMKANLCDGAEIFKLEVT